MIRGVGKADKQLLKQALTDALLNEGSMDLALYQLRMEEEVPDWLVALRHHQDSYLFGMIAEKNSVRGVGVALILLEPPDVVLVNEAARERLQTLWQGAYEAEMRQHIHASVPALRRREVILKGFPYGQDVKPAPTVATVPPLFSEPLTAQETTDLQARMAAMKDSSFASLHELVMQESQRRKRQQENDLLRNVLQQLVPASAPLPEKPVKPPRRKPR